jgi:hypothetical protein
MADLSPEEIQVHEGRAVGMTVSVRLRPEEAEMLVMLSRRHNSTLSDTLRLALHSLARSTDFTTLRVQSSGLGRFTVGSPKSNLSDALALTA